jgi:hypothetical protein
MALKTYLLPAHYMPPRIYALLTGTITVLIVAGMALSLGTEWRWLALIAGIPSTLKSDFYAYDHWRLTLTYPTKAWFKSGQHLKRETP